ncbi:MAG: protein-tyrosine-phosphatase [Pseudomonadota bacterium]|nr:protein-tyrosine-phosphatase [Pseudomonadota bacterium]
MTPREEATKDRQAFRPASVLFVCAMNAIRSPMAEYLTRHLFDGSIYAESAGVHAGDRDPFAEAVMAEAGMPLTGHTPSTLDDLADSYFDLVVTLSPEAHHRALEMTRSQAVDVEYWPTFDPSSVAGNREQVMGAYRQLRDTLERRIRDRFAA